MDTLNIEYVKTKELKKYKNNAKIHTKKQVKMIEKSIQDYGFNDPIAVWKDNEIIEGHGRLEAAENLGLEVVPIIRLENLTDEQRKAYMLVHNKTQLETDLDDAIIQDELKNIGIDLADFGFEIEEKAEDEEEKPEVKFTEVLGEENNYIVLKFNQDVDWLQLQTLFKLTPVMAYSTRTDGKINDKLARTGIGRVVDGADFLYRLGVEL